MHLYRRLNKLLLISGPQVRVLNGALSNAHNFKRLTFSLLFYRLEAGFIFRQILSLKKHCSDAFRHLRLQLGLCLGGGIALIGRQDSAYAQGKGWIAPIATRTAEMWP